jgi:hypothetical protein
MKTTLFPTAPLFAWVFLLGISLFFTVSQSACSKPDPVGIANATNMNTDLVSLMKKGTESYSTHATAITKVQADIEKAYEHAKSGKRNKEITESWRLLRDDITNPYFARWKEKGKLDKDFINEQVKTATKSLEAILKAEKGK